MNIDEYQEWTRTTAIYPKKYALEYTCLGLSSESGELCGIIKKVIRDSNHEISPEVKAKLLGELGDIGYYFARLADELGFKLSDVLAHNVVKLEDRKSRGVLTGSGDNR